MNSEQVACKWTETKQLNIPDIKKVRSNKKIEMVSLDYIKMNK